MEAAGTPAPDLRPLGIGEVLDVGIKIYWRHALTFFAVVLVVVAPVQIVAALIQTSASADENGFLTDSGEIDTNQAWLYGTGILAVTILGFVASALATGACFKGVADAYLEERPYWRSSLAYALRRVHSIMWVTFLATAAAIIGAIFCFVPGVYLYVAFAVAIPVLMTEGVKGTKALGRSRGLVRGRWWPTFAIVLLGFILTAIVSTIVTGLFAVASLSNADSDLVAFVSGAVSGTLSSMLTTPFQAAYLTVLYVDLRVRKEGFDLQLLAERIGLAPRPEGWRRAPMPERPAPAAGEPPPYWPPPPYWTPPPPGAESEEPPYWPPPPGWKPSSDR